MLVDGRQCPACLKHFANNDKLCNLVRHSRTCKILLVGRGFCAQPVPSRRFDDGSKTQLPAVQAAGPQPPVHALHAIFEVNRPSEEVLLRLEKCFAHGPLDTVTFPDLVAAYRRSFSAKCLQRTRLLATQQEWERRLVEELDGANDHPIQWGAWHMRITHSLAHVAWAAWLAPEGHTPSHTTAVYREAETLLPWGLLDVGLPTVDRPLTIGRCFARQAQSACHTILQRECQSQPALLEATSWPLSEWRCGVTVVSFVGLPPSFGLPLPLRSFAEAPRSSQAFCRPPSRDPAPLVFRMPCSPCRFLSMSLRTYRPFRPSAAGSRLPGTWEFPVGGC